MRSARRLHVSRNTVRAIIAQGCVMPKVERADRLEYLHERLAEVGIHTSPFEAAAETLLVQSV